MIKMMKQMQKEIDELKKRTHNEHTTLDSNALVEHNQIDNIPIHSYSKNLILLSNIILMVKRHGYYNE